MSKADVQELVEILSAGTVTGVTFERDFEVVLRALATSSVRWRAEVVAVTAGSPLVQIPDVLTAPPVMVFYDAQQLSPTTFQELRSSYGRSWRDMKGSPVAFSLDQLSEGYIRLFPTPDRATEFPIVPLWSPLGADLAYGGLILIAGEYAAEPDRLPQWLNSLLALLTLSLAAAEDSPTQDLPLSQLCAQLGAQLRQLLKV